jgi:hypothetical protein
MARFAYKSLRGAKRRDNLPYRIEEDCLATQSFDKLRTGARLAMTTSWLLPLHPHLQEEEEVFSLTPTLSNWMNGMVPLTSILAPQGKGIL